MWALFIRNFTLRVHKYASQHLHMLRIQWFIFVFFCASGRLEVVVCSSTVWSFWSLKRCWALGCVWSFNQSMDFCFALFGLHAAASLRCSRCLGREKRFKTCYRTKVCSVYSILRSFRQPIMFAPKRSTVAYEWAEFLHRKFVVGLFYLSKLCTSNYSFWEYKTVASCWCSSKRV